MFRWPPKDPQETLDFSIDWSRFLSGATISSFQWQVEDGTGALVNITNGQTVNGIQCVSTTSTNTVTTIYLGNGTLNLDYRFVCRIVDSRGNTTERSVKIKIKEQ